MALHVKRLLTALILAPIRAYQRWISPLFPQRCKYHPSCSTYGVQAVRELGVIKGSIVAGWRVVRCNPFSHGGVDELADRRLFRAEAGSSRQAHDREVAA